MGSGASKGKGIKAKTTVVSVGNKDRAATGAVNQQNRKTKQRADDDNTAARGSAKAAFRTPRNQVLKNPAGPEREVTLVQPILRKSVSFSEETVRNDSPKNTAQKRPKPILKTNSLRVSSAFSSDNVDTIDDYGDQLFEKLEALAGKIVEGYTPREEKPDRSELIIPEIKYGCLSASTPRDSGPDGIPTVDGRTPTAVNGTTSSALPLWESSNAGMQTVLPVSKICDIDILSSSQIVVSRNGAGASGIQLYDVTRDSHSVIGESTIISPRGLAVDRSEKLIIVTDAEGKTVKFIDYEGQHRGSWKENKFKHPGGIARTREGRYIISDVTRGEQAIREYSAYGKMIKKFGLSWFDWPWYLAADSKGRVIVSERSASTIYIFDNNGNLLTKFGGQGKSNGKLGSPSGVTVDDKDNILVADSDNYRVCMFSPDGRFIKNIATHYLAKPTSLALFQGNLTIATDTSIKMSELPTEKQFLS